MSAEINSNNQSPHLTKINSDQLSSLITEEKINLGNNVGLTVATGSSNYNTSSNLLSTMMSPNNIKKITKINKVEPVNISSHSQSVNQSTNSLFTVSKYITYNSATPSQNKDANNNSISIMSSPIKNNRNNYNYTKAGQF